jgi:hypothetical protein
LFCCSAAAAFTVTAGGADRALSIAGKKFGKVLIRLGDEPSRPAAG